MSEDKSLAIPMMPIEELKRLTAYVNDVKKTLMKQNRDYIIDGKKQYTTRSGFAKLAQGFNLSDDPPIMKTLKYDEPKTWNFNYYLNRIKVEGTATTDILGFEAVVVVRNPYGRYATGEGACTVEELHMTNNMSPKWYHRCLATAKTRAYNRAISNFVGSADVSAEEMGLVYDMPETERKAVDAEQRDAYPSPEKFNTPTWDIADAIAQQGWNSVDGIIGAYLFDMGYQTPQDAFEVGHDIAKAWVRNAQGVYLGDAFKEVDTILQIAGFKYNKNEKRWRYTIPEGAA